MIIEFINYTINGALLGLLYSLVAMGFVVIYRASKVFNMAIGEMIVLGAFLLWWAIQSRGMHPALGIAVALGISVLIGLAIERLLFRRLIGESVFSMIMVTIGLLILMRGLVLVIWGPQERQFPAIFPLAPIILGEMIIPRSLAIGGLIAVLAAVALHWFFNRSRTGLAMSAVAEDHQIALAMGISVRRSIAFAWALGGVLSVITSMVYLSGKSLTVLSSEIGFAALPVALLAGLESIGGLIAVVAAVALHWFFNRSRTGLAMAAVAEDHQIALAMGISVRRSIAFAWALGGVLSVITSMVYLSGKSLTFLSSEIGFAALPVALLAGLESIGGLLLAGIIVGVVQGLTAAYIDPLIGGNAAAVVPYIFMLVVLVVRPTGMFGWKRIERV